MTLLESIKAVVDALDVYLRTDDIEELDRFNALLTAAESAAAAQDAAYQRAREAWGRWDHTEGWTWDDIDAADTILREYFKGGE